MKAYLRFTELYIQHIANTLFFLWRPEKNLVYCNPVYLQPMIDDILLLDKELKGEPTDPEAIKACWGRAHDRGFL